MRDISITIDGKTFDWPFCAVKNCDGRRCLSLNSVYCYPHSMGMEPIITREEKVDA